MDKKIRILHVVTIMDVGGIETTLMNYLRNVDRDKLQFDFLVHRTEKGHFDDEIKAMGGKIYYAPSFTLKNIFKYNRFIKSFFKENRFDVVHSHLDSLSYFPLKGAMKNGITVRIAHSHVNNFDNGLTYPVRTFFKSLIPLSATNFMACSQEAGEFMFPNRDFEILINPIDTEKFKFNPIIRNSIRSSLGLDDKVVIGHVGRFDPAKNHSFLLELATLLPKEKYYFLFIGTGPLISDKKAEAQEKSIENIDFLGVRDNVSDYLSAMDIFVMPSFYEGLGIAAIEAQASGLYTIVSTKVSPDVKITDDIKFLDLDLSTWSREVLNYRKHNREEINTDLHYYDVKPNSLNLQNKYIKYLEESL